MPVGTANPARRRDPSSVDSEDVIAWTAAAPGRVNLVGEHTDYNGLPVLPMTLDRDVRVRFRMLPKLALRLSSDRAEFPSFAFRLDGRIRPAAAGHWSNYVRAAAKGLLDHGIALERGIVGNVSGSLPVAVGLSSSSALVVASALALLHANGRSVAPLELAELAARAERFAGAEGGGMDQAASLCGVANHALRIDFGPLRATPVPIPERWRWVVASSLARAEKTGNARAAYNARVRECREAACLLAASVADKAFVRRLPQGNCMDDDDGRGAPRPDGAVPGAPLRPRAGPMFGELVSAFGTDALLDRADRILPPALLRRTRHVLTEARRVELAQRAMAESRAADFGALMVQSHESLRDDYGVSTPELDAIVSVALQAGAAGARLTGAGFGGCAIVLCDDNEAVMEALAERFYAPRLGGRPRNDELFVARPSSGAQVRPS